MEAGGMPTAKKMSKTRLIVLTCCCCLIAALAEGQFRNMPRGPLPGGGGSSSNSDSLIIPKKRPVINITIHYRHLEDVRDQGLDSSINDFTRYLPLPADQVYLGNLGTPSHTLIFNPRLSAGFDAGFHALDAYRFTLDSTRFYQTTRPYTKLNYLIGSKQEQLIEVFHTQNPKENFNFGFHFRKINSPGFFQNQNTDGNSYNIFGHYNTKNKRYNAYLSFVGNKLHAGENGGIKSDASLENPDLSDRRTIPVNLGGSSPFSVGFFSSPVATKSDFRESSWLFSQHYDWGRGDTVKINDTTYNYEFHPSFRIAHTLRFSNQTAAFTDTLPETAATYYFGHYGLDSTVAGKLLASHRWKSLSNDLSLIKFPSLENAAHFLKIGATFDYIQGDFLQNSISFYNFKGHAEYHNLTRDEKWNLDGKGELYLLGHDFGDYMVTASLSRYLNEKLGDVTVSFTNLNQTPSFVYGFFQSNRMLSLHDDLKKTNLTLLQFRADNDHLKYHLKANYYLITNYTYFKNFDESAQYTTLFNFWQILLSKQFTVGHFNWYMDLALQQASGNAPLHVPHLWTRNRLTYENTLFKNLILCTGLEGRYHTAYYGDDYSPLLQQFVYQDVDKINLDVPDVAAFVHFRIKSFVAYVRAENLNTFISPNLIEVPHYPYPDFTIRVGLSWVYLN
jgi:hypothetical protein